MFLSSQRDFLRSADFVLFGQDPNPVDAERIKDIPVVRTIGGRIVHPKAARY